MKAGQTSLDVGTKVKVINIKGEDKELNGIFGSITHPFSFGETKKGWVGIYADKNQSNLIYGEKFNVHITNVKIL